MPGRRHEQPPRPEASKLRRIEAGAAAGPPRAAGHTHADAPPRSEGTLSLSAYLAGLHAANEEHMRRVTVAEVQRSSFTVNDVNLALDVRGVRLPHRIKARESKFLLLALLCGMPPELVVFTFGAQGVLLRDRGGGQWEVLS